MNITARTRPDRRLCLTASAHGTTGDIIKAYELTSHCSICGEDGYNSLDLHCTSEQAAQIVRTLAPFAGLTIQENDNAEV